MASNSPLSPVITVAETPYTATGSTISIPTGHILTWQNGISTTITLAPDQALQTITIGSGGTPIVVNGATQKPLSTPTSSSPANPTKTSPKANVAANTTSSSVHTTSQNRTDLRSKASTSSNSSSTGTSTPRSVTHAQQTSSSPTSSSSHHGSSSDGLSKGATAGIAVGCAAVGALLAALLVFLLMRKRRQPPSNIRPYLPDQKSPASSKETGATASPLDASPTVFTVAERELPQPPEDMAIGGEISKLQTLIKNFTQSYYDTSPAAHTTADLTELGSIPIPPAALATMLADPKVRLSAIRYCLMWTITSRIAPDSDPRTSLLPPEIIACLSAMPNSQNTSSPPTLAPWRALTHHLLLPTYPSSPTTSSTTSNSLNPPATQLALRALDTILQPYAAPNRDSYERLSKLEEILKRGARFGWMLFGQVAELGVEWRGEENVRPVLLERVGKGRGRVLWEGEGCRWRGGGS